MTAIAPRASSGKVYVRTTPCRVSSSDAQTQTLTVRVPFAIRKRGGRKQVVTPDGSTPILARREQNTALVKAIARAFRWRDLLETGAYATIDELAKAENINPSYLSRTLRLTLLPPTIVEAALDGSYDHPNPLQLTAVVPTKWMSATI